MIKRGVTVLPKIAPPAIRCRMLVTEITADKQPVAICFWLDADLKPHFTELALDLLEFCE